VRAPREVTYKWIAYSLCIMLLMFLRLLLIPSLTIWGVMPFLPPLLLAAVSSLENPRGAVIFGLAFGVFCDLLLNAPFPCLYTLAFTIAALLSAQMSQRFLQTGFLCALILSILTFTVVAVLNVIALGISRAGLSAMLSLYAREMLISLLFLPACYPLFLFLHRFFAF